jgi:hypothetical protein
MNLFPPHFDSFFILCLPHTLTLPCWRCYVECITKEKIMVREGDDITVQLLKKLYNRGTRHTVTEIWLYINSILTIWHGWCEWCRWQCGFGQIS